MPTDVVHSAVLGLWSAHFIHLTVVDIGKVKLELTDRGWIAADRRR